MGYILQTVVFAMTWHILGDRLIPEQLLCVDRGILHLVPTKSLTFSPGDLRVAMMTFCSFYLKRLSNGKKAACLFGV